MGVGVGVGVGMGGARRGLPGSNSYNEYRQQKVSLGK